MNDISSSQIIETIYKTLNEDIITLHEVVSLRQKNKKELKFLESLIESKLKIKETLPTRSEGNKESVSTPLKTMIKSYIDIKESLYTDKKRVALLCYEIEKSQRHFIKMHYAMKGIPNEIKLKLKKVMEIYDRIFDHLVRAKSTDQLGFLNVGA